MVLLCLVTLSLLAVANARIMDIAAFVSTSRKSSMCHHRAELEHQRGLHKPKLPLYVMQRPLDEMSSSMKEDGDEERVNKNNDGAFASQFVDLDSIYDPGLPEGVESLSDFDRDEDDILTEREDRFYIDKSGHRRKVEKCILVGVEDLSAKRKMQKQMNQNLRYADLGYPLQEGSEDMLFTLEESLTEMRELIKTSGLECVGGKCSSLLWYFLN